jgi:hypothetical protein
MRLRTGAGGRDRTRAANASWDTSAAAKQTSRDRISRMHQAIEGRLVAFDGATFAPRLRSLKAERFA